jgi:four helix bundle protein
MSRYKAEYVKHLTYAQASCDETTDHLETLSETGSLADTTVFESLLSKLKTLGRKLNLFIQSIERAESTGPAVREGAGRQQGATSNGPTR